MLCTQFSAQRGPSKGSPDEGVHREHHARHSSLLPNSPSTSPNQRVTSHTFYCCDTYFWRSLHPVQSLRLGATRSGRASHCNWLLCVIVCGLGTRPFSCFISVGGSPLLLFFIMSLGFKQLELSKSSFTHTHTHTHTDTSLTGSHSNASEQLGMCLLFPVFPECSQGQSWSGVNICWITKISS